MILHSNKPLSQQNSLQPFNPTLNNSVSSVSTLNSPSSSPSPSLSLSPNSITLHLMSPPTNFDTDIPTTAHFRSSPSLSDHESIDDECLPRTAIHPTPATSHRVLASDPDSPPNHPTSSLSSTSHHLDPPLSKPSIKSSFPSRDNSDTHYKSSSRLLCPSLPNQVDARKDTSGRTKLFKSVRSRDPDKVRCLLDAGANVNHKDHAGWTPLHEAMVTPNNAGIVQLLLERGANPNAQGLHGNTPLHDADTFEYLASARSLLKYGASVSVRNEDGDSPLNNANTDPEIMSLLQHYSAIEDALLRRDAFGMTLLHRACWELTPTSNDCDLIEELVACRRVDVNVADNAGWTPLHELVAQRRLPLVHLLLRHGADVNARGYRGTTPLHIATKLGDLGLVEILLDHGADPHAMLASGDGDAPPEPNSSPIHQCTYPLVLEKLKSYPFVPTRAEQMRQYMLDDIAQRFGTTASDWGGPPMAGDGVFSDGAGCADDTKSERSRDDVASVSAGLHRGGGTSISGGSRGSGVSRDRKLTREDRLMASYIARIERQEKSKSNKSTSSSSNPSPTEPKRPPLQLSQKRPKSLAPSHPDVKLASVKIEPCVHSSSLKKLTPPHSTHQLKVPEVGASKDPEDSTASMVHSVLSDETTVQVNDLVQYCSAGDAARVAKSMSLTGVVPKLPKSILAATRAGHADIVKLLVDRLFVSQANKSRASQANGSAQKRNAPSLSIQHIVTAALHQAVKYEHVDVAGYLLSKGARPSARNRSGLTPIEQAKTLNNSVLVALLQQSELKPVSVTTVSEGLKDAASNLNTRGVKAGKNVTVIVGRNSVEVSGKRKKGGGQGDLQDDDLSDTDLDSDTAHVASKKVRPTQKGTMNEPYPPTTHFRPPVSQKPGPSSPPFLSSLGFQLKPPSQSSMDHFISPAEEGGVPTVMSVQYGTRFVVLEGDVRAYIDPAAAIRGVFREATHDELAALADSPFASVVQKDPIPPRVALLDELVAALHASGAAPLLVRFAGWRPSGGVSKSVRSLVPSKLQRSGNTGRDDVNVSAVAPREAGARVVPPKIMFKHCRGGRHSAK